MIYTEGWLTVLSFRPASQPIAQESTSRCWLTFRYVSFLSIQFWLQSTDPVPSLLRREGVSTLALHPQYPFRYLTPLQVCGAPGRPFLSHVLIRGSSYSHVCPNTKNSLHRSWFRGSLSLSIFRTSHKDVNINETSSYVDLAPLYGNGPTTPDKVQDNLRVRDGRGLLHPDVFAEDRLLLLPPGVCALLVLFNRNHNVCVTLRGFVLHLTKPLQCISTLLPDFWK
jgi:hypothetical protein